MRPPIQEVQSQHTPESLAARFQSEAGAIQLHSALPDSAQARYSFVTARPFLTFRSFGSRCELKSDRAESTQFGNPWCVLDEWMARYELLEELDSPFPLGGCFGYWGYDLKGFVEPKLSRRAVNDLELPDCCVGFYDSLVVFDHQLGKTWIVSTGLDVDGTRTENRARERSEFWKKLLETPVESPAPGGATDSFSLLSDANVPGRRSANDRPPQAASDAAGSTSVSSNFTREAFMAAVAKAQRYIGQGDIYQVNLAQRLSTTIPCSAWELFQRLVAVSPAPFSAYLNCGDFQIASSSPELFLRLSGSHILTRPIKGTRPRSSDPDEDARWNYELLTSPKDAAELVMITDLLRNDLGRVCEYGSIRVPELMRLERYPQVQHLVSTVEGRLRGDVTHFAAFSACFPGGSITGAPKIRAMEIIDELEPIARGPYTGALGYLGFNRESQLSILIRAAVCRENRATFHVGAGIVADSQPAAEYDETLAKAGGFLAALSWPRQPRRVFHPTRA